MRIAFTGPVSPVDRRSELQKAADEAMSALSGRIIVAAKATHPTPTPRQVEAGNYKKGRVNFQGLPVVIETAAGGMRHGIGHDGKEWHSKLVHAYGYVSRTEGKDGDHVDVILGPHPDSELVHIVNQLDHKGNFDEHKVVLGALNRADASRIYHDNYQDGWDRCGRISQMTMAAFKEWLAQGKRSRQAPLQKAESHGNSPYADVTEMVPVSALKKFREYDRAKSPRDANDYAALKQDIAKNGIKEPLMLEYQHDKRIASLGEGNHRLAAAEQLGHTHVPVRVARSYSVEYRPHAKVSGYDLKPRTINGQEYPAHLPGDMKPSEIGIGESLEKALTVSPDGYTKGLNRDRALGEMLDKPSEGEDAHPLRLAAKAATAGLPSVVHKRLEEFVTETGGDNHLDRAFRARDGEGPTEGYAGAMNKLHAQHADLLHSAYEPVRHILRKHFGDTVPLYRMQDEDTPETRRVLSFADHGKISAFHRNMHLGRPLHRIEVPIDKIHAVPHFKNGYREFIVDASVMKDHKPLPKGMSDNWPKTLLSKADEISGQPEIVEKAIDKKDTATMGMDFDAPPPAAPAVKPRKLNLRTPPPAAPITNLEQAERQIHPKRLEFSHAFKPDGTHLFGHSTGDESQVEFTDDHMRQLHANPGVVFTHNHPAGWEYPADHPQHIGTGISVDDMAFAAAHGLGEVRAVTPTHVHSLKPGKLKWGSMDSVRLIRHSHTHHDEKVRNEFMDQMDSGKRSLEEANRDHNTEVARRVAKDLGMEYMVKEHNYGKPSN